MEQAAAIRVDLAAGAVGELFTQRELLQYEDPQSERVSDARHWAQVYGELLTLAQLSNASERAGWLASRHEFWLRRWKELRDLSA